MFEKGVYICCEFRGKVKKFKSLSTRGYLIGQREEKEFFSARRSFSLYISASRGVAESN